MVSATHDDALAILKSTRSEVVMMVTDEAHFATLMAKKLAEPVRRVSTYSTTAEVTAEPVCGAANDFLDSMSLIMLFRSNLFKRCRKTMSKSPKPQELIT